MGIFSRMSNMIKAKVNDTLDDMEDPIELLDQKLRDMTEQFNKARLDSAKVIGNSHDLKKKLEDAKIESANLDEKVKLALSRNNEELAKKALSKKMDVDKKVSTLEETYKVALTQGDTLKKNLAKLEAEIEKTRSYRDEAAARLRNAEANQTVNEILSDVQTKSNSIQIDSIERKIQGKESLAAGLGELRDYNDLESEFAELDTLDLDLELEKYKNSSSNNSDV